MYFIDKVIHQLGKDEVILLFRWRWLTVDLLASMVFKCRSFHDFHWTTGFLESSHKKLHAIDLQPLIMTTPSNDHHLAKAEFGQNEPNLNLQTKSVTTLTNTDRLEKWFIGIKMTNRDIWVCRGRMSSHRSNCFASWSLTHSLPQGVTASRHRAICTLH